MTALSSPGSLALSAVVALVLALAALPAGAEVTTPAISDAAGDANGVNGQQRVPGAPSTPSTKPASVDSADLRSVHFSTAYAASKVKDPQTGAVLQVKHIPTALVIQLETEAAIHPASAQQMRPLNYDILVDVPSCTSRLRLQVGNDPATDTVGLGTMTATCPGGISETGDGITRPAYSDKVATLTFPFSIGRFGDVLRPGTALTNARASVSRAVPFAGVVVLDEAGPGTAFTIGQDVPADIDCATDPTNPACAP